MYYFSDYNIGMGLEESASIALGVCVVHSLALEASFSFVSLYVTLSCKLSLTE